MRLATDVANPQSGFRTDCSSSSTIIGCRILYTDLLFLYLTSMHVTPHLYSHVAVSVIIVDVWLFRCWCHASRGWSHCHITRTLAHTGHHWSALIYATLRNDTLVTADTEIVISSADLDHNGFLFFVQIFFCFSSKVKTETKNVMILIHVIHWYLQYCEIWHS